MAFRTGNIYPVAHMSNVYYDCFVLGCQSFHKYHSSHINEALKALIMTTVSYAPG